MDNLWKWEKRVPNLFSCANWFNRHDFIFDIVREVEFPLVFQMSVATIGNGIEYVTSRSLGD